MLNALDWGGYGNVTCAKKEAQSEGQADIVWWAVGPSALSVLSRAPEGELLRPGVGSPSLKHWVAGILLLST